ncbi:MAG: RNA polymerase sigma factor [Planctomycetota bacterium]|nr:RNA polymerase sigma factor [Planctomycetota bacterium]
MTHTAPPRANLRSHLRWRTLDPLRARVRDFLQLRCGDAHLADDLSQETFVRALFSGAAVERFDRPDAWLIHVARNVARDHLRRSWARPAGPIDDVLAEELVAPGPSPAALEPEVMLEVAGSRCDRDRLTRVLPCVWRELSSRDRQVLSARYFQGRSVKDVANEHGVRPETAKVWLYRARGRLRTRIERFVARGEMPMTPVADVTFASICAEGQPAIRDE